MGQTSLSMKAKQLQRKENHEGIRQPVREGKDPAPTHPCFEQNTNENTQDEAAQMPQLPLRSPTPHARGEMALRSGCCLAHS